MDYAALISKLVKEFKTADYKDIEAALVRRILLGADIRQIKNLHVRKILTHSVGGQHIDAWLVSNGIQANLQLLEKFYELNIVCDDRKINGAYYSPEHIVSYIVKETTAGKTG